MGAFKRAVLYLMRKPGKAAILTAVMTVACSMALLSSEILGTTQTLSSLLKQSAAPEIAVYEESGEGAIDDDRASKLATLDSIKSINRIRVFDAFPRSFNNIEGTRSDPGYDEAVRLNAFDDLSLDSPFSDQLVRLVKGKLLGAGDTFVAVIHVDLAESNSLTVGDHIALESEEGQSIEAEIVGLYAGAGGNEGEQGNITARNQSFNQIYVDNTTAANLGVTGFREIRLVVADPDSVDKTQAEVTKACGAGYATEVYDSTLTTLTPSLDRTASAAQATLALVALTGIVAVSMLLALWSKQRTHEQVVLLSLGKSRAEVAAQAIIESAALFVIASCIAFIAASLLMPTLTSSLIPSAALTATQSTQTMSIGTISPLNAVWISLGGLLIVSAITFTCAATTLSRNPRDLLVAKS